MLKRISSMTLAAVFCASFAIPSFSEEPAKKSGVSLSESSSKKSGMGASLDSWLKDLRKRVARTRARQNQVVAVAAVRGSETEDAPPLYWKGKKNKGPVEEKELAAFETAVESAIAGEPDAENKLKEFVSAYPKSSLAPDANAAIQRIQTANAAP